MTVTGPGLALTPRRPSYVDNINGGHGHRHVYG